MALPPPFAVLERPERLGDARTGGGEQHLGVRSAHGRSETSDPVDGVVADVPDEAQRTAAAQHAADFARGRRLDIDPVPGLPQDDRVETGVGQRQMLGGPRERGTPRTASRRAASMSASGSTATTSAPSSTTVRVSLPVPAPTSATRRARPLRGRAPGARPRRRPGTPDAPTRRRMPPARTMSTSHCAPCPRPYAAPPTPQQADRARRRCVSHGAGVARRGVACSIHRCRRPNAGVSRTNSARRCARPHPPGRADPGAPPGRCPLCGAG